MINNIFYKNNFYKLLIKKLKITNFYKLVTYMCMYVRPYVVQMILNIRIDYMNIGVCYRRYSSQVHESTETSSPGKCLR